MTSTKTQGNGFLSSKGQDKGSSALNIKITWLLPGKTNRTAGKLFLLNYFRKVFHGNDGLCDVHTQRCSLITLFYLV